MQRDPHLELEKNVTEPNGMLLPNNLQPENFCFDTENADPPFIHNTPEIRTIYDWAVQFFLNREADMDDILERCEEAISEEQQKSRQHELSPVQLCEIWKKAIGV